MFMEVRLSYKILFGVSPLFPCLVQPHLAEKAATDTASGAGVLTATTDAGPQQAPYTIIVSTPCIYPTIIITFLMCVLGIAGMQGSMSESGLGLLSWWSG